MIQDNQRTREAVLSSVVAMAMDRDDTGVFARQIAYALLEAARYKKMPDRRMVILDEDDAELVAQYLRAGLIERAEVILNEARVNKGTNHG